MTLVYTYITDKTATECGKRKKAGENIVLVSDIATADGKEMEKL